MQPDLFQLIKNWILGRTEAEETPIRPRKKSRYQPDSEKDENLKSTLEEDSSKGFLVRNVESIKFVTETKAEKEAKSQEELQDLEDVSSDVVSDSFNPNEQHIMKYPKGKLIAIGGSEDKTKFLDDDATGKHKLDFYEAGVLRKVLNAMRGVSSRIEVITTASSVPYEIGEDYVRAFAELGNRCNLMHIKDTYDVRDSGYINRIKDADGVLFTGGDQVKLCNVFRGSEILEILHYRYQHENFVIAGTSAGAMAMSEIMIEGGNSQRSLMKGEVTIGRGLGFISRIIIDSHFMQRGRFGRLVKTVAMYPDKIGIGLGEDTAVIISRGTHLQVIGSGHVIIVDGSKVKFNNIHEVEDAMPFSIDNLIVHVAARDCHYDLKTLKMTHRPEEYQYKVK